MSQSSKGAYSPNIKADSVKYSVTGARKRLGVDTATILKVVDSIRIIAKDNELDNESDLNSVRNLDQKIKERFSEYENEIRMEYSDLMGDYGSSYKTAMDSVVMDELDYKDVLRLLKKISKKALEEADFNPMVGLENIKNYFVDKFEGAEGEDFSEGAIKYYLIRELIECNVFPNITEYEKN